MPVENSTQESFNATLHDLWSIESMLVETLPRLIKKSTSLGLNRSLALHLAETDQHKVAIQAICKQLGIDCKEGEPDAGLLNILQEGERMMMTEVPGDALDEVIIASCIKVEQYEIARYELAAQEAEQAGHIYFAKRLRLTLEEEHQSETKLKYLQSHLRRSADVAVANHP